MAFGSVLRGLGRIASYGMAPASAMTPPTFAGSPYDPSEFSGEPYDPEYATTGIPAAIPPTPKPKPLPRLDAQQEAPEAKPMALPPPKRLDAREEFANIGAPPLPGDYRSGAYKPPSIKRQLLGGLLRMTPVVNATNIPEDVEAPGYRQKAMEYKGNVETAARRAALQNEKEGRAIQEETRATANKQLQRQEERDRLIDQDRDRAAKQAVLDRLPPGSEVVDAAVPNDPDHTYRNDDFGRVLKIPTPAKLARDKKEAEQVNWLPVPQKLQQEFGLGERAPQQTFDVVIKTLELRQQQQAANELKKYIADQSNATRRDTAAMAAAVVGAGKGDARTDRSYNFHIQQLSKIQTPIETAIGRMSRLKDTLNENTPQADALVAPELLTVMAGGQGSGLRMNEAEIARIIGGRSNWETFKAAANKWRLDPKSAVSITPAQRQQIHALVKAVDDKLLAKQRVLSEAHQEIINASDPAVHRQALGKVSSALSAIDQDTAPAAASGPTISTGPFAVGQYRKTKTGKVVKVKAINGSQVEYEDVQ